jgi:hypothetical protein
VLKLDGSLLTGNSPEATVQARGLRLAALLSPTKRITGTGLIDGKIALRTDARGLWIERGELHARTPGSVQVTDAEWRKSVATMKASPLPVQAALTTALMDFTYDTLVVELAGPGPGSPSELRVTARGRGQRNKQELDIAIGVRGIRDSAARLTKGHP